MTDIEQAAWEAQLKAISTDFVDRLDMFEEAGQVTSLVRFLTETSVARVALEFDLELTEDNAAQFVTHIAMALSRLQRGEFAEPSAILEEELRDRVRERQAMRRVVGEIEQVLDREVPASEVDYLTIHLCALLEDE